MTETKVKRTRGNKPLKAIKKTDKKQSEPEKQADDIKLTQTNLEDMEPLDASFERKILIGMITDDKVIEWVTENFGLQYFASDLARTMARWCFDHYTEHKKAPKQHIDHVYFEQLKTGKLNKELAETIEQDMLPSLSDEYVKEGTDTEYVIAQAQKYLYQQQFDEALQQAETLKKEGKFEEAKELFNRLEPPTPKVKVDDLCFSTERLMKADIPEPPFLMKPWLREGEIAIIYAKYGVGKSLLAQMIALSIGSKDNDCESCDIGSWQPKQEASVLYIDGEMKLSDLKKRKQALRSIGEGENVMWLNRMYMKKEHDTDIRLDLRKGINLVKKIIAEHPEIKLVIADTISSLFDLESENDSDDIKKKIDPLISEMRSMDIALILLDHENKGGGLRGSSHKGAHLDHMLRLKNADGKQAGEAWFTVESEKQRDVGSGNRPFELKLSYDEETKLTSIEANGQTNNTADEKRKAIVALFLDKVPVKDIAKKIDCSTQYVYDCRDMAIDGMYPFPQKLIEKDKKTPTKEGKKWREDYFDEFGED